MSPSRKKLSTDLLQLIDEHYLPPVEDPKNLKTRMVKLGQLSPSSFTPELMTSSEGSEGTKSPEDRDKVYVYIYLDPSASLSLLDPYCEVVDRDENKHIAVAWVPVSSLEALASLPDVKVVRTVLPPVTRTGSVSTEGDLIHNSSRLRQLHGVSGAGIKIWIISDGVDSLGAAVASGDLPPDVHVLSNKIGGDEGTAMLEIVHDIAPGAELYFHDCGKNGYEFNSAIDELADTRIKTVKIERGQPCR
ncbi:MULTISPECIES: hypothetical protein [unclassified Methanosarcina]|uniref:hypothetical protein n=1 Tax=unclassified Methanosarcina TaxID=2644672 RepID=UPI00138E2C1B|nr:MULTISPECIES: hypothetical protein [unclassified Methanosarcina]